RQALAVCYTLPKPILSIRRRITTSAARTLACVSLMSMAACGSQTSTDVGSTAPRATNTQSRVDVLFTYGSEKQPWIEEATAAFNRSNRRTASGKVVQIQAIPTGSGDCVDEILTGKRQPDIISPASAAFIKLGNAESQVKTGRGVVGPTRNLVLSPVVI